MNNNLRFISIPIKILLCIHLNIFVIFGLQKICLLVLFLFLIEEEPCSTREYPSHKLQLPHRTSESCLSIITDITQMTRRRNQSQIRFGEDYPRLGNQAMFLNRTRDVRS